MRRILPYNHPSVRRFVWAMTDGRCAYCGILTNPFHNFTIDHIVPRHLGGTDDPGNLLPACASCNSSKGCLAPEVWLPSRETWLLSDQFRYVYGPRRDRMLGFTEVSDE